MDVSLGMYNTQKLYSWYTWVSPYDVYTYEI